VTRRIVHLAPALLGLTACLAPVDEPSDEAAARDDEAANLIENCLPRFDDKGSPLPDKACRDEDPPLPPPPPRGDGVTWLPTLAATGGPTYFLHRILASGDATQCNGGVYGAYAAELGAATPAVVIDTDQRTGACYQQFAIFDPTNRLAGLQLTVNAASTPGGDGQCIDPGERTIPITTAVAGAWTSWSRHYQIDTDSRAGGCQQTFTVSGRSDVVLEIDVQPTLGGDVAQCPSRGTFQARAGEPATIVLDTDGRAGGCTESFRLRIDDNPADLPSLFSRYDLTALRNATTSVVVGDLQRAGGGYVLPPSSGRAIQSSFVANRNLAHCATMQQLQQTSRDLAAASAAVSLDSEPANVELEQLREVKRRTREYMASHTYQRLERQLIGLRRERQDVAEDVGQLLAGCPGGYGGCPAATRHDIDELNAEIADLDAEIATLTATVSTRRAAYDDAHRQLREAEARIAVVSQQLAARITELARAHGQILAMYAQYAALEGGTTVLAYQSGWDANLARLQADNPTAWFRPMSTSNARVMVSLAGGIGADGYLSTSPSFLRYTVNGAPAADGEPAAVLGSYPKNVTVLATTSLVAACAQSNPALFDIEKSASGLPVFAMTVAYQYPTAFIADVGIEYNRWRIYQALVASGHGLRNPSVTTVLDGPGAADRIRFDWGSADVDPELSREAEERIALELIQEVIAAVGEVRYVGDGFSRSDMPAPPRGGVVRSIAQSQAFALRALTATTSYNSVLGRASSVPREVDECAGRPRCIPRLRADGAPSALRADRPLAALAPTASTLVPTTVTVAVPGDQATNLNEVSLGTDTSPRAIRILTSSLRIAKARASYDCGWHSLWCDGFTWVERVRNPAYLQQVLDGTRRRRYGQLALSPHPGSTLYVP
jgi:hypothetical protein